MKWVCSKYPIATSNISISVFVMFFSFVIHTQFNDIPVFSCIYCWVFIFVLPPFLYRLVFTRRWHIDNLGIFHANQTSICLHQHQKQGWGWYHKTSLQERYYLLTVPRRCFFCGLFLLFMFRVCHAAMSVYCSLVVTCWERANLLAHLCLVFSCVLSLSHVVSWDRRGTWLYRSLIFAFFLTSKIRFFIYFLWQNSHKCSYSDLNILFGL